MIQWKEPKLETEWDFVHPELRRKVLVCVHVLENMGFDVRMTSILRHRDSIDGESGVHATLRACDLTVSVTNRLEQDHDDPAMQKIAKHFCDIFPRHDKYPFCLWHNVGHGLHFHFQQPWTAGWKDADGSLDGREKTI